MKKTFMSFIENENSDEADLYIYGDIGESDWWSGTEAVSADDVRNQLANSKASIINVHIQSLGGSTFQALAIYNLLRDKSKTAKIVVYIDGIAASAASIIAMAGDEIKMPSNTLMMIHNCWTVGQGNAKELRKTADDMDKIMESVMECYLSKIKISKDELMKLLDEETYLTAEDAYEKGFCTEIIKLSEDDGINQSALSSLKNIIINSRKNAEFQNAALQTSQVSEPKSEEKHSLFNLK